MSHKERAIKMLADGFKSDLAEYIINDETFTELMMTMTEKFIDDNIPVCDEQNRTDLAFHMFESLRLTTY